MTEKKYLGKIAVLPGDGIGPEIIAGALQVLRAVERSFGVELECHTTVIGGAAYDETEQFFPSETAEICSQCDAILFGSVGGPVSLQHLPKWKGCEAASILALRERFQFFANFRPARVYSALQDICPLRREITSDGVDVLILRELLGDIYFGEHREEGEPGNRRAKDSAEYTEEQIKAIAHQAFRAAEKRSKKVSSVDKANVLATSRLWRAVVTEVSKEYPDITLEHVLVDNCAMQLVRAPGSFDVILTANLFGDILSDIAAVLPGSLGLTPSASISASGFGMFEPSGGSAPDIAGKDIANPTAAILSLALLFRFSLNRDDIALAIERAVESVLDAGYRTKDIANEGQDVVGTKRFSELVAEEI